MQTIDRQSGMTMWGLLFVLGVIAFAVFLTFKLLPPYLQDLKVKGALDSLARQPDFATMSRSEIGESLSKRFDIDDVTHVNLGEALTIEQRGRLKIVRIKYDAVVPMVANISALLEFDHRKEVRASE